MHCVALYPTPDNEFYLNQIDLLKKRYPGIEIGWSTHENPDELFPAAIAFIKGATLLERHIGKPTDKITLNAYSSNKDQLDNWIKAAKKTITICGRGKKRN